MTWQQIDVSSRAGLPGYDGLFGQVRDKTFEVEAYRHQTLWGEVIWLRIMRNDGGRDFPFLEKQRIKDELVGPVAVAVEIYPGAADLCGDVVHSAHLWVLPRHYHPPFGLRDFILPQAGSSTPQPGGDATTPGGSNKWSGSAGSPPPSTAAHEAYPPTPTASTPAHTPHTATDDGCPSPKSPHAAAMARFRRRAGP